MNLITLLSWSWNTVLGIVLFFVSLGVLVTIHECGHFIAAKSFNVYCSDFSIGFGPKFIKIKRKSGETKFSIGIIPLGGYVQMYGEGTKDELPDGVDIPKSRSIAGISRWKRYIIFGAGIMMNFILAYLIFFIAVVAFPHYQVYQNVVDSEKADSDLLINYGLEVESFDGLTHLNTFGELKAKDKSKDLSYSTYFVIDFNDYTYDYTDADGKTTSDIKMTVISDPVSPLEITDSDGTITKYLMTLNINNFGMNNVAYSDYFVFYEAVSSTSVKDQDGNVITGAYSIIPGAKALVGNTTTNVTSSTKFLLEQYNPSTSSTVPPDKYKATYTPKFNDENKLLDNGLNMFKFEYWFGWNSFGEAGRLWADSCGAISKALGGLFIGQGWENVGGPVAILDTTTSVLINNPFYIYLYDWAMISVNLALFNLLPFPGLDGWQILVEIIESIVNQIKKNKYNREKKEKEGADKDTAPKVDLSKGNDVSATNESSTVVIGEDKEAQKEVGYVEWKIPSKIKGIMSYVGLGLLFAFAIVIFVMDIIKLF